MHCLLTKRLSTESKQNRPPSILTSEKWLGWLYMFSMVTSSAIECESKIDTLVPHLLDHSFMYSHTMRLPSITLGFIFSIMEIFNIVHRCTLHIPSLPTPVLHYGLQTKCSLCMYNPRSCIIKWKHKSAWLISLNPTEGHAIHIFFSNEG